MAMSTFSKAIRWPRVLSPAYLAYLIRRQKNPFSAIHLFLSSPSLFPSYRHNPQVVSSLSSVLLSCPSLYNLLPSLLLSPHSLPSGPHIPRKPSISCNDSLQPTRESEINSPKVVAFTSPPLPDSLFAEAISSLPLHLSLPLFLSLPNTNCIEWTQSFNCIISKLLSHNQPKTAIEIFAHFSRHSEVRIGSQTLDMLISYLLHASRPDLALELYKEYHYLYLFPSQKISCMLVKGLVEHNFHDEAMHLLYSMMRDYNIEAIVVTCRTVIEALCLSGRAEEAERVLKRVLHKVRRRTGRVRAFLRVPIDFERKSVEEVRETVDFVLSISGARSVKAYETIVGDMYEEKRFHGADNVFDEMTSKGFRPSVCMYEAKMEALCREGKLNDAVRILEKEMREKDCVPTVKIFNFVIEGLCKNGKSMKAIEYLKNMKRWPGCKAKKETFEILIDGLCAEKRYVDAGRILDQMVKQGHRPMGKIFDCVIQGFCRVGNRFEAVLWLEEMVAHGLVPNSTLWYSLVSLVCENASFEVFEDFHRNSS